MTLKKGDPHILTVWRIRLVLVAVALAFLSRYFISYINNRIWWLLSASWVAAFFYLYIFYYPIKYRKLSYSINKHIIVIYCGVFYRRVKATLFTGVQYVSVVSTPLERLFGICSLYVYSAGSTSYIRGLSPGEASRLQRILTPSECGGDPLG